jgi:anti-anti-sigma factor
MTNNISSRLESDVLVVTVAGTLTDDLPAELRLFIEKQMKAGIAKVILDLNEVTLINSLGIGTIIVIFQQLQAVGGHVIFLASGKIASVFSLTKLDTIVTMAKSVDEGIKMLSA